MELAISWASITLRADVENDVPRVVFTSSRDVYGEPVELPVEEESPLLAINSYGASKVAGEVYCRAFRREFGLQTVILRLASVYGLRDIGGVIPTWLRQAQAGQEMRIYGGKQVLDFVWVGQVVEALVRAGPSHGRDALHRQRRANATDLADRTAPRPARKSD